MLPKTIRGRATGVTAASARRLPGPRRCAGRATPPSPCARWSSPTCTSERVRASTCCAAPALREPLLAALDGVDRLVLLGDTLELRQGPAREVLDARRGRAAASSASALGGRRGRRRPRQPRPRADRRLAGARASAPSRSGSSSARAGATPRSLRGRLAALLAPARGRGRLPRPVAAPTDVYATHGHYLDCT